MERELFESRFRFAVDAARRVADGMVTPALPAETMFRVLLNQSDDGNARAGVERTFPGDPQPDRDLSLGAVVTLLWRDGWIPEWIDVAVIAVNARHAIAELRCCGRFSDGEDLLYYRQRGTAPFGIKSPYLPLDWRNVEDNGRFCLPTE